LKNQISLHNLYHLHLHQTNPKLRHHSTSLELSNRLQTTSQTATVKRNTTNITSQSPKSRLRMLTSSSQATIKLNRSTLELTFKTTSQHTTISLQCHHPQGIFQQYLQLLPHQMATNSSSQPIKPQQQMIHSICFLD